MRAIKLPKSNEKKFLELLKRFGDLWAPIPKGEKFIYAPIDDVNKIAKNALRTIIPLKKLLVEPEFCMLRYDKFHYKTEKRKIPKRVVFGVHPCEIHAVNTLDKFYTYEYTDSYYLERRENLIIVGLSCIPDEKCFCNETHTDIVVEKGFDLFLVDLDDYYLIWIGSNKGDDIIREGQTLFEEKLEKEVACKLVQFQKNREKSFNHGIDLKGIADLMELEYNADFWNELGEKCLGCGQCTMACPTCTCFNMEEQLELTKEEGKRVRYWDSCLYREYSLVAGGHNFREARSSRLKLWYTHKLKAFIEKFGDPSCVGCGRCIDTCPVNINVKTIVSYLKGKEVDK